MPNLCGFWASTHKRSGVVLTRSRKILGIINVNIHVSMCICIHVSAAMSTLMSTFIAESIYPFVHIYIYIYMYLYLDLHIHLYLHPCLYLHLCIFICIHVNHLRPLPTVGFRTEGPSRSSEAHSTSMFRSTGSSTTRLERFFRRSCQGAPKDHSRASKSPSFRNSLEISKEYGP